MLPEMGSNGTTAANSDSAAQITVSPATPTNPYCRVVEPFLHAGQGARDVHDPPGGRPGERDVQSNPGPELAANYVVPNAIVRQRSAAISRAARPTSR